MDNRGIDWIIHWGYEQGFSDSKFRVKYGKTISR